MTRPFMLKWHFLIACMAGGFLLAMPRAAWADRIHLTNGQMLEGIVIRETNAQVVLQIAWEGYIVLDRASVAGILPATERERKRLLTEWKEEHDAFLEREERRRQFEAEQRAKGLILYDGQWVPWQEVAASKAQAIADDTRRKLEDALKQEQQARKRAEEERKVREEELTALTERLRAMQEEQLRLQQEISSLRCILARPQLIVQHLSPRFMRDEHGNLLQVGEHAGHLFVTTSDGAHADLQIHGDRFGFTDPHGIRHDLEEVLQ